MQTSAPDTHTDLRDALRALCAQFPPEYHRKFGEDETYPEEFVDALTREGWLAAMIPEEYGGSGLGLTEASIIMMASPKIIAIDEPSLGLAPMMVRDVYEVLKQLKSEGTTFFLVEQNSAAALSIADYAYVMENGRIVMDGPADKLADNEDIKEFYLGVTASGERKSYRDIKHYRRRKRWLG